MVKFQCSYCAYKFETNGKPKKCPYCGRGGGIMNDKSAEDIIKEVDELLK